LINNVVYRKTDEERFYFKEPGTFEKIKIEEIKKAPKGPYL
jgi:hypothetical protein